MLIRVIVSDSCTQMNTNFCANHIHWITRITDVAQNLRKCGDESFFFFFTSDG